MNDSTFSRRHMLHRAGVAIAVLLTVATIVGGAPLRAAPIAAPGYQSSGEFDVVVNQVDLSNYPQLKLYVTVTGSSGDPVLGILSDAFSVDEDGVTMEIKEVTNVGDEPDPEPIKIVLAMDTSSSVEGQAIEDMKVAATEFAKDLDPRDKVALVGFNQAVSEIHPFTNNTNVVRDGIASLQAGGGTALFEAIHRSAEIVDEEDGRRAFVLLTDGWNDTPLPRTLDQAAERAVAANAPGYVLGFGSAYDDALQRIADETGGRYFRKPSSSDIRGLFTELTGLITSQYEITYDTNITADSKSHDFTVTVERDGRSASGTKSVLITPADIPTPSASPTGPPRGTATATPTVGGGPPDDDPLPQFYICVKRDDRGGCIEACRDRNQDGECDPTIPPWLIATMLAGLAGVLFLAARRRRERGEEPPTDIHSTGARVEPVLTAPPVGAGNVHVAETGETILSRPGGRAAGWFIGLNEEVKNRRFPLQAEGRGQTTFGRGTDNTHTIEGGGTVSRHHAMVKFENGRFVLRDLGARNPTLVNGRTITRYVLDDDDEIKMGRLEFVFKRHRKAN